MKMECKNEIGKPLQIVYTAETPEEIVRMKKWNQKTNRAILNKKGRKYAVTTR